ncbi:MAG TPA: CBS domain-containing protein [Myxococcota bacterium]|nr:CBS domain-containing protein [Myxococcota bacterium]
MVTVHDLMTPDPANVSPELGALQALDLMIDLGIRHLPVLDARGRLCGVVSLDDLRAALPFEVNLSVPPAASDRADARDLGVGDVMSYGAITARPDTPLGEAAALLARYRIGCLPVVDESGKVVGIFTERDALHALASEPAAWRRRPAGRVLDLELLVAELRAERSRIAQQLAELERSGRELAEGRRGATTDQKDRAAELADLSVEEPLASLAARRLGAIGHALARAARGQFGACESCGRDIPIARLRALPGTSVCRHCAEEGSRQ